jgi:IS5 family transposase
VHDSQKLEDLLDLSNTGNGVWADSAYRSDQIEANLKAKGLQSRIHRRAARNHPVSERQKSANTTLSKVRARVEHVFGQQQNSMGGKIVRTIGTWVRDHPSADGADMRKTAMTEGATSVQAIKAEAYKITRFNALRHGVLSRYTVLPWENADEYKALAAALVAQHSPQGPTEEHLVEELAGILWRKRRLRLAEAAAFRRGLTKVASPDQQTSRQRSCIWRLKNIPPMTPQTHSRPSTRITRYLRTPSTCFKQARRKLTIGHLALYTRRCRNGGRN